MKSYLTIEKKMEISYFNKNHLDIDGRLKIVYNLLVTNSLLTYFSHTAVIYFHAFQPHMFQNIGEY